MTRVRIQPYGVSKSARIIAEALNETGQFGRVMRLKKEGNSSFRPRSTDVVVNWGSSSQRFDDTLYINKPSSVALAANKLKTFQHLDGEVRIPEWTTDKGQVEFNVRIRGTVYCRTQLNANSGRGIVVATSQGDVVDAPLYTYKVDCNEEYRVHVFLNERGEHEVFDIQQKRKRRGVEADGSIRNTDHGYVFCRDEVSMPLDVGVQAMLASESLDLDFCGVDVGYNTETGEATVFEVNTACGIEGTTLKKYTEMLSTILGRRTSHV